MTRPPRHLSSRSQNLYPQHSMTGSRPFLNMLNPLGMSRAYGGYAQANQSVVEEEEEENGRSTDEERDLEAQTRHGQKGVTPSSGAARRQVSWEAGGASEMNILRPNIRQQDKIYEQDSSDGEVPQSFMIEAQTKPSSAGTGRFKGKGRANPRTQPLNSIPSGRTLPPTLSNPGHPPLPGPAHLSDVSPADTHPARSSPTPRHRQLSQGLNAYERALWNWVNIYNLDAFLQEVYYYYEGKGIYSIALARGLNLLFVILETVGFVIGFSTFLLGCVDYSRIRPEGITRLLDVVVDRCISKFSGFTLLLFILFTAFYCFQIVSFVFGVARLVDMYNFYTQLLKIPDADIQTISWPEVVRRITAIREENPLTAISSDPNKGANYGTTGSAKLDAHDIANRIMRQENYLIALFNKELLDVRVPFPHFVQRWMNSGATADGGEGKGRMLTRALEWNLRFCLMGYLFDVHGRVRKVFLKQKNRAALIEGLKRRFIFMGILNAIFAPFIVLYLLMYSFFRYFDEYHKNPSSIGGRRYTPFAQWKFREFNELPHLFERRLDESYPAANIYIGQFPNEKMTLILRFLAFIAGSFAAVLLLASILDPDLFLHFEITPHGTVLFYLGVFASVLAVARGMIPDDNRVFDPELLMMEVIQYTHYMPGGWKGMLHSKKVHKEFGELFAMKILIFVQELVSVVVTPFVLWLSLPQCAPAIIDFFHDFSIHVEGRGYVCSFAEFDFHRHGNVKFGAPTRTQDRRMLSNEGKMEKSFLNFKAANPDWNPTDPFGSLYLNRMSHFSAAHGGPAGARRRIPFQPSILIDSANLSGGLEKKRDIADRAQEYDRALRQSQYAAARRRHGSGSVVLADSGEGAALVSSPTNQSTVGIAQTAVLGDSQGSVAPPAPAEIGKADLALDGGVGSELGESYVDGNAKRVMSVAAEEEEAMEDDGVLGLLAQIYGTGGPQGRARVI